MSLSHFVSNSNWYLIQLLWIDAKYSPSWVHMLMVQSPIDTVIESWNIIELIHYYMGYKWELLGYAVITRNVFLKSNFVPKHFLFTVCFLDSGIVIVSIIFIFLKPYHFAPVYNHNNGNKWFWTEISDSWNQTNLFYKLCAIHGLQ